jgi:hypothetical protein
MPDVFVQHEQLGYALVVIRQYNASSVQQNQFFYKNCMWNNLSDASGTLKIRTMRHKFKM